MSDQVIKALRGADPARSMPAESTALREATRESILSSDAGKMGTDAKATSRPSRRRRLVIVGFVTALFVMVVAVGGAWAYFSYYVDARTALGDFHAAQSEFTLPPGVHWKDPNLPTDSYYGTHEGWLQAWFQSTGAWLNEWLSARDANDASRKKAAAAAMDHLISIMPVWTQAEYKKTGGENGSSWGIDETGAAGYRSMVKAAKRGDFSEIESYLKANYDYNAK